MRKCKCLQLDQGTHIQLNENQQVVVYGCSTDHSTTNAKYEWKHYTVQEQ